MAAGCEVIVFAPLPWLGGSQLGDLGPVSILRRQFITSVSGLHSNLVVSLHNLSCRSCSSVLPCLLLRGQVSRPPDQHADCASSAFAAAPSSARNTLEFPHNAQQLPKPPRGSQFAPQIQAQSRPTGRSTVVSVGHWVPEWETRMCDKFSWLEQTQARQARDNESCGWGPVWRCQCQPHDTL